MTYLGLVPSEYSSGHTVHRAGITKAENALARRALIEGAWTYRVQARVSRKLHDRIEGLPQTGRDMAWKAQVRLCTRYRRLAATGKPKVVVTTTAWSSLITERQGTTALRQARSQFADMVGAIDKVA